MIILTVSSRGRVTLPKNVLQHLGINPGENMELNLLPNGRVEMRARTTGTIDSFIGMLAGKSKRLGTTEEVNEAIADGWAGASGHHSINRKRRLG